VTCKRSGMQGAQPACQQSASTPSATRHVQHHAAPGHHDRLSCSDVFATHGGGEVQKVAALPSHGRGHAQRPDLRREVGPAAAIRRTTRTQPAIARVGQRPKPHPPALRGVRGARRGSNTRYCAPPRVTGPLRRRPTANPGARAANAQQPAVRP
jgi:hypothetical protein